MKKLMMIAAIVCAAASVQAGVIKWKSTGVGTGTVLYAAGDSSKTEYAVSGMVSAYLFDVATVSRQELLDGLSDGTFSSLADATPLDTTTINSSSKIAEKTTPEIAKSGSDVTVYWAVLDGDNLYLSSESTVSVPTAEGASIAASWTDTKTASQKAITSSGTVSAAGWYAVAVPEPTSGLLLLLGMAGLALRRRRA